MAANIPPDALFAPSKSHPLPPVRHFIPPLLPTFALGNHLFIYKAVNFYC